VNDKSQVSNAVKFFFGMEDHFVSKQIAKVVAKRCHAGIAYSITETCYDSCHKSDYLYSESFTLFIMMRICVQHWFVLYATSRKCLALFLSLNPDFQAFQLSLLSNGM